MRLYFIIAFAILLITGCGGGSGGGGEGVASAVPLNLQESQRYFPFTDGNVWVSRITNTVNDNVTASYTSVSRRAGTRLIGNIITSVMSITELPSVSMHESYLVKDDSGLMAYGNNDSADTLTASLAPYRVVSFPIQVGASFQQVNKTGLNYGRDLDGDRKNEKIDISANVFVRGFETVTTAAGTFQNCLRVDTNVTETLTVSSNGARITVTGVETDWYAQDIGPVKQTITYSGNGQRSQVTEELTGYIVDGRSSGLNLQASSSATTITSGASTQLSVMLLDSTNYPLIAVPAVWTSDNNAIATVDANGMATGNRTGMATLTPSVGGVAGPQVTLKVLVGFRQGVGYPGISSSIRFGDTAMGDLNGDGRNDLAVLEGFGSRILVYFQNAAGTMNPPQVINTDLALRGIAVRDVNNDGLADLVVSGNSTTVTSGWKGRVLVFKQDPVTHTLGAPQEYVLATNNAGTLAIADLNNDSLPDVVIASADLSGGNGVLSFLFQGPGGTFGPEVAYNAIQVALTAVGAEIHVADMNSDGLNDIVVQSGLKLLAVIKQVSPGIFSTTPDYYSVQTNGWPYFQSFALGDLNGDGRTDIAVADLSGNLNIFLQKADGTLSPTQLLNYSSSELKIFDIDSDGLNDLLLLNGGNTVTILKQSSAHTFQDVQIFLLPTKTVGGTFTHQAMSVGDVTGDGLPDIVASWSFDGIYVLPRR